MIAKPPSPTDFAALVARAVRVCNAAGVMDFNGHVSARDGADPNVMWINNRHSSRSTLTAADVVPFDIAAGKRIGEGIEPPSEWHIHAAIYRHRPNVRGIVHSHPELIVTLSAAGQSLKPISQQGVIGADLPEEGAPVFDSPVQINTPARGEALVKALGDAPIVVLRQHGAVTVGDCVEQAVVRMICAETNARQLQAALQVGKPQYLAGEEWRVLAGVGQGSSHGTRKLYEYYEETARKSGALD
jgi:ribulose-5-phosphate 4-epimerase/fuculose-1-phosphate aldolase